jgi:molybdopterin molybdotransferase
MIRVEQASAIIQSKTISFNTKTVDLSEAIGHVLAESIRADRDFPPFNRVAMDGIAIQANSFKGYGQSFFIEGVQAAGQPQLKLKNSGSCIEVMTGSVLPENTDTVIRYEDLTIIGNLASVSVQKILKGSNIHPQGQDASLNEILLSSGQLISSAEVALLASVGKSNVKVFSFPDTAIISSGDELVDIDVTPEAHQIRRSNTVALQAAMLEMHWPCTSFHLTDSEDLIKQKLGEILEQHDVVILSGGVSKGKFDFIPKVLAELGIQKLIHQVSQRPGKPFWFGTSRDEKKVVFALPGNPVSTFLCFYKYVKPWALQCSGFSQKPITAVLASDINFEPSLTYFLQVEVRFESGVLKAYPHAGGGSGDFANLKTVSGFLELPAEKSVFKAGEAYPFISFR